MDTNRPIYGWWMMLAQTKRVPKLFNDYLFLQEASEPLDSIMIPLCPPESDGQSDLIFCDR